MSMSSNITWHGCKPILLRKIVAPGDIESRRREPHVIKLSESLTMSGGEPAEPIILEHRTNRLLCGRDRFAACLLAGRTEVDARFCSGSPEALAALTEVENAYRRHSIKERDDSLARLVNLEIDTRGNFRQPAINSVKSVGRPTNPKTEAIREVAEVTGNSESVVRKAVDKAEQRPVVDVPDVVIDTLGMEIPTKILKQTSLEKSGLTKIHKQLVQLQRELTLSEKEVGHQYQTAKAALHDAARAVADAMPESVCLWCKLVPAIQPKCLGCRGKGWLTVGEHRAIGVGADGLHLYEKLKERGAKMGIFYAGKFLTMKEAAGL
jgi:hypothetical protein